MTGSVKKHVFFVDDEPKVRKVVGKTLEHLGVKVSCFANSASCLKQLGTQTCDLLITDVKMPNMNGIELLTKAKRIIPPLPVLVITGYGDIPMAVRAMKAGASDFIEKPLNRQGFLSTVESLLTPISVDKLPICKPLTDAEMRILLLILEGKNNSEIAAMQHRSIRTIEDHRYKIMRKLDVYNIVGLIKKTATMGLFKLTEKNSSP